MKKFTSPAGKIPREKENIRKPKPPPPPPPKVKFKAGAELASAV